MINSATIIIHNAVLFQKGLHPPNKSLSPLSKAAKKAEILRSTGTCSNFPTRQVDFDFVTPNYHGGCARAVH